MFSFKYNQTLQSPENSDRNTIANSLTLNLSIFKKISYCGHCPTIFLSRIIGPKVKILQSKFAMYLGKRNFLSFFFFFVRKEVIIIMKFRFGRELIGPLVQTGRQGENDRKGSEKRSLPSELRNTAWPTTGL